MLKTWSHYCVKHVKRVDNPLCKPNGAFYPCEICEPLKERIDVDLVKLTNTVIKDDLEMVINSAQFVDHMKAAHDINNNLMFSYEQDDDY
jgi:hypothetical protein